MQMLALAAGLALLASMLAWPGCARAGGRQRTLAYSGSAAAMAMAIGLAAVALAWLAKRLGQPVPFGAMLAVLAAGAVFSAWQAIRLAASRARPRRNYERVAMWILAACAAVAVFTTIGIIYTVLAESYQFFEKVSWREFLFGIEWSPQIAIRDDQAGASGAFGMVPLLAGTLLISAIAMAIALPLGLLSAIYMSQFAQPALRDKLKPCLEFLAGVPTVVYGFFAVVTLSPLLRDLGGQLGVEISGESALAAGIVIGAMTIPFVASLAEDALAAVPAELREGSLGLGATDAETALRVVVPAALPGIVAGFLLALSRAIGETMIVVMAAGLAANLTANPLETVTTVTVQIVTLLIGDQAFDDPKTLAAFALGLLLFVFTLLLNVCALGVVRKYQERYD